MPRGFDLKSSRKRFGNDCIQNILLTMVLRCYFDLTGKPMLFVQKKTPCFEIPYCLHHCALYSKDLVLYEGVGNCGQGQPENNVPAASFLLDIAFNKSYGLHIKRLS